METKKPLVHDAALPGETSQNDAYPLSSMNEGQHGIASIAAGKAGQLSERQQNILERRGINIELALRMGWRNAGLSGIGEFIDIPYFRDGREVNHKRRSLDGAKQFSQKTGGEKIIYNLEALKTLGDAPLIITEGEMDCMIALQCGFMAVSVPDGAPAQEITDPGSVKYDYLADIPKGLKKIILATDGDGPGVNLMNDLALRLGKHRCWWVKYPKGCKDLNEVFNNWQERGVKETIDRAQPIKIDGLYRMNDLPPIVQQVSFSVGIPGLENHFRLRRGDFSVVTGIPSHGKSTWVNHVTYNMAKKHHWHICFASFEQPPQSEHRRSLRTLFNGKPENCQSMDELLLADQFINEHFSFIVPDDESDEWADLDWLKERMAAAVVRNNAYMVVIDPWNEMDHQYNGRETSLTQYVGIAIKELKRFARRFNVHVMVVAHPAKLRKDKDGEYPVPSAYDISDSAHWYNKAEQVVVIHRQPEGTEAMIRIAKSRYHHALGSPADVTLTFNDHDHKFY